MLQHGIMALKMIKQIVTPTSPIKKLPNELYPLETEGLFGELFLIYKSKGSWSYGKLENDGYLGWIKNKDLKKSQEVNHKISSLSSIVYKEKDIKTALFTVPFGSLINVIQEEGIFVKILFNKNYGYIFKNDTTILNKKINLKLNKVCEKFINTPYFWGGKTYMGIDCSALLQLSLSYLGLNIRRNTSEQIKEKRFKDISFDNIKSDDLIFWKGHVAIVKNKRYLIHANGYTMDVSIEPINYVIDRLSKNGHEIKKIVRISENAFKMRYN